MLLASPSKGKASPLHAANLHAAEPPPPLPSTTAPTSAVPLEGEGVAALPRRAAGGTDKVVGAVALLAQATVLATGGGEPAALAVLHDRLRDPLDAGVVADGRVRGVHRDHLLQSFRDGTRGMGRPKLARNSELLLVSEFQERAVERLFSRQKETSLK